MIIKKKIEIINFSQPGLDGLHLEISSQDGVVILGGHIHSTEEHAKVLELTEKVEGVKRVVDNIQLKPFRYSPFEP